MDNAMKVKNSCVVGLMSHSFLVINQSQIELGSANGRTSQLVEYETEQSGVVVQNSRLEAF